MAKLAQVMLSPGIRPDVIQDCAVLLDQEIERKTGPGWVMVKGAYFVLKTVNPGLVERAINGILNEAIYKIDVIYENWERSGSPESFEHYLQERQGVVVDALLEISDAHSERTQNAMLRKFYQTIRPSAVTAFEEGLPGFAAIVQKYCN